MNPLIYRWSGWWDLDPRKPPDPKSGALPRLSYTQEMAMWSKEAQESAAQWQRNQRQNRIAAYQQNPNLCKQCCLPLPYDKWRNTFCSSSCACIYNTTGRVHSESSKVKISQSLQRWYTNNASPHKGKRGTKGSNNVVFATCSGCGNLFAKAWAKGNGTRRTCSRKCSIMASVHLRTYQNGSRKPEWYFCQETGSPVLLESSWEVATAKFLDSRELRWVRPPPIQWVDGDVVRHYFPDFYLPDYDLYLDPKNPYCMARDKLKMETVSKSINIVYGPLKQVIDHVGSLAE